MTIKSKAANLRRHKLLHGPKVSKLKCCYCEQTFSNQFNFKVHCERAHPEEEIVAGIWVKENAKRKTIFLEFCKIELTKNVIFILLQSCDQFIN